MSEPCKFEDVKITTSTTAEGRQTRALCRRCGVSAAVTGCTSAYEWVKTHVGQTTPPFPPCSHCGGWGHHEAYASLPCPKCGNLTQGKVESEHVLSSSYRKVCEVDRDLNAQYAEEARAKLEAIVAAIKAWADCTCDCTQVMWGNEGKPFVYTGNNYPDRIDCPHHDVLFDIAEGKFP